MARGMVPRQPSKSGKQAGAKRVGPAASSRSKSKLPESRPDKTKKTEKLAGPAGDSRGHTPAKGYNPVAPERVKEVLKRLDATYPDVTCALTHQNAWQLLVATILSAQCTDERVNKTTPELFRKYPTPQSLAKMESE